MVFPASDRLIFKKNPLTQVVCQLRFPPILTIAATSPAEFQNRVREKFPLYERAKTIAIPSELAKILESQIGSTIPAESIRHLFSTESENSSIALTQDFIALTEKSYTRWEEFRENLQLAEDALTEAFKPSFYTRLGLRYVDSVDKAQLGLNDIPWRDLIRPELASLLAESEVLDSLESVKSEAVFKVDDDPKSFVKVRYGLGDSKDMFVVDADFYTEVRCDSEQSFERFDRFNELAGNLFRWAIQPRLREALEPDNLERTRRAC